MTPGVKALITKLESLQTSDTISDELFEDIMKFEWCDFPHSEEIGCNMPHYLGDEDIRAKDAEYKDMQDAELEKLIFHLRREDYLRASKVSFLHVSS